MALSGVSRAAGGRSNQRSPYERSFLEPLPPEAGTKVLRLGLIVADGVPADRLDALLAVATHCTVHNTLASEPEVSITLADAPWD